MDLYNKIIYGGLAVVGVLLAPAAFDKFIEKEACSKSKNDAPASHNREQEITELSVIGKKRIADFEGYRDTVYLCASGHKTIGFGHKLQEGESFPNGITRAEGLAIYKQDSEKAVNAVKTLVKVPLKQHQFDALVSFTFNKGRGTFRRSDLLKYLNQGNYDAAAAEFKKHNTITKQNPDTGLDEIIVLEGLTRRRKAEEDMFTKAIYPPPKKKETDPYP